MKSVVVYCGSRSGDEKYTIAAQSLGEEIARSGLRLIYGGGSVGLMGTVATTVMKNGGHVIGVIPDCLNVTEVAHSDITQLHVVADMHARKKMMVDLADAAIVLPGGFGTLDECFEFLTWSQLKLHQKPCGLLNVHGFYDLLLQFIHSSVGQGFLHPDHRDLLLDSTSATDLIRKLQTWTPAHREAVAYINT